MAKLPEFSGIGFEEMQEFLEENYQKFNARDFILHDPISIPHHFTDKQDIEISGFLTATISWGRRDLIISSASKLMKMMGERPYQFLLEADGEALNSFREFYYRTFQGIDCLFFLKSLRNIYTSYNSLEDILYESISSGRSFKQAITDLRNIFFEPDHEKRSEKHFADPDRGAAGKRLNMFFRWMVRNDNRGVDFGIWNRIPVSELFIPLDFHTGNTSRKLGLLTRNANDWKAVEELTSTLRLFDPHDPVKYDYALFGLGVNKIF